MKSVKNGQVVYPKANVRMGVGSIELEPPENAHIEFEKFFNALKNAINTSNYEIWNFKLYQAVILSHMFPDGNGRTARNIYAILSGKDTSKLNIRPEGIVELGGKIVLYGILQIYKKVII